MRKSISKLVLAIALLLLCGNAKAMEGDVGYRLADQLLRAAEKGNTAEVKLLLSAGADVLVTDKINRASRVFDIAKDNETKFVLITYAYPKEIWNILPGVRLVREAMGLNPLEFVRDVHVYLKLEKAKQYLPNYPEDTLCKEIEKNAIEALRKKGEL